MLHSTYTQSSRSGIHSFFSTAENSKTFFRDTTRFTNVISVDEAEIMLEDLKQCFLILKSQDYMRDRIYDRARKSTLIWDLKSNYRIAIMTYAKVRMYDKKWKANDLRTMMQTAKYMDETDCPIYDDEHFRERSLYGIVSRCARLARYCQIVAAFHNIVL